MDLFAEGIESLKLACSLVLLMPAIGIALLGRRRVWLVPTWIVTVSVVAWLRFSGQWDPFPEGIAYIATGVALIAATALAWKRDDLRTDIAATAGVAFVAAWTWVPCVGRELGDILNNARAEPWAELIPTVVYMTGLFVPLIVFAALGVAVPRLGDWGDKPAVRMTGLVVVAAIGGLVATTLFDDLAGELFRRSSF